MSWKNVAKNVMRWKNIAENVMRWKNVAENAMRWKNVAESHNNKLRCRKFNILAKSAKDPTCPINHCKILLINPILLIKKRRDHGKNSYECCAYKSVDDRSLSKALYISKFDGKKVSGSNGLKRYSNNNN